MTRSVDLAARRPAPVARVAPARPGLATPTGTGNQHLDTVPPDAQSCAVPAPAGAGFAAATPSVARPPSRGRLPAGAGCVAAPSSGKGMPPLGQVPPGWPPGAPAEGVPVPAGLPGAPAGAGCAAAPSSGTGAPPLGQVPGRRPGEPGRVAAVRRTRGSGAARAAGAAVLVPTPPAAAATAHVHHRTTEETYP